MRTAPPNDCGSTRRHLRCAVAIEVGCELIPYPQIFAINGRHARRWHLVAPEALSLPVVYDFEAREAGLAAIIVGNERCFERALF